MHFSLFYTFAKEKREKTEEEESRFSLIFERILT